MKSWLFYFLMNKLHILTCFDESWSLALEFDKKVKVWLFSIQLTFDQLTAKFICQSNELAMFWTMSLGKNDAIGLLKSWLKLNLSFSRLKIRNCPFLVKTLILTIWWFDQISWGIVVQTWSNDTYESKVLMWITNYEVWL